MIVVILHALFLLFGFIVIVLKTKPKEAILPQNQHLKS